MSQTALTNLGINYNWNVGEDGWKAGVDNNWVLLDGLVQANVFSKSTTTPPGTPAAGDRYIVPASGATGAWSAKANNYTVWNGTAWIFVAPLEGWLIEVADEDKWYYSTGSAWKVHSMREGAASGRTLAIVSNVVTVDLSLGLAFDLTLTANVTTFTLSNPAASGDVTQALIRIKQDGTGGRTITWPAALKWPAGVAYVVSTAANAVDLLRLTSYDGGTTWYGDPTKAYA
jgi:hypothetical protein